MAGAAAGVGWPDANAGHHRGQASRGGHPVSLWVWTLLEFGVGRGRPALFGHMLGWWWRTAHVTSAILAAAKAIYTMHVLSSFNSASINSPLGVCTHWRTSQFSICPYTAAVWRRKQELLEVLEQTAPQEGTDPSAWAMGLRNAHERYVQVGGCMTSGWLDRSYAHHTRTASPDAYATCA